MISSQLKSLIDDLSTTILRTNNFDAIERARAFGYFLLQSPNKPVVFHSFDFWESRWKKAIKPTNISRLKDLKYIFSKQKLPIFSLLDSLKRSSISEPIFTEPEVPIFQNVTSFTPVLSEETLVPEIIKLLKGEQSEKLVIENETISSKNSIASSDARLIKMISKIILCLRSIKESKDFFSGKIGMAMRSSIDEEYLSFINAFSALDENTASFISILALISGQLKNKIYSTAILCESIKQSTNGSLINSVLSTQKYGLQAIRTLGSKMIELGMEEVLLFIRDWIVSGVLNDDYNEFFIVKNTVKLESGKWWNSKYTIIDERIPFFLNEKQIIYKILTSGRAHNFLRKYQNACSNYMDNFGYSAPFAVNFDQPKAKRTNPNLLWKGPKFELNMVDEYFKDSMKSLMYMMMTVVWIPGHLKVVQDFLLFNRGDFAAVLYQSFNESVDGDAPSLLLHSINSITNSKDYTNSITKEILTDRIDMMKKWSVQPSAAEARITYLVNPPIDAFLGKEVLQNYDLIGNLIWKLKCCECQLGFDWHNARRLQLMMNVGFKSRNFCLLRHLMIFTIRTILEYISTDIILVSYKKMESDMEKVENFDDLFAIHTEYMNKLLVGTFQTPEYSVHNRSIIKICETINEFTDIDQELEEIYLSILNQVNKNKNWKQKENPFFAKTVKCVSEINSRIIDINGRFNEQLGELYLLTFDNINSLEMNQLEIRLRSCVANIQ